VPLADLDAAPPLRSPREGLLDLPDVTLGAEEEARIVRGQPVTARTEGARALLTDGGGAIVAIAERQGEFWAPRVVLRDA
jgi:hypothetical protein